MKVPQRYIIQEKEEYYNEEENVFALKEIKRKANWWNIFKDLLGIAASIAAICSVIISL